MPDAMPKMPTGPGIKPPRSAGPRPTARRTPASRTRIKEGLEGYTQLGSFALAMAGDPWSSKVFEVVGPRWAEAMADLAMSNPQVERALSILVEGGTWGAAVGTSIAMVAPIIAARAPIPPKARETIGMLPVTLHAVTKEQFEEFVAEQRAWQEEARQRAQANGQGPAQA